MSCGREMAEEADVLLELHRVEIQSEAEKGLWTMRDGTVISVDNMSTSHLKNTIAMLNKHNEYDMLTPWILRMEKELERRSE